MVRVAVQPRGAGRNGWAPQTQPAAHDEGEQRPDERTEAMPGVMTPEILAERVCRTLDLPAKDNAESLTEILRVALTETRDQAIEAAKAVCLEIAEDEAARCRGVGATVAQQTALTIAARIRKRHVEVARSNSGT
jgi:hypothetical protein